MASTAPHKQGLSLRVLAGESARWQRYDAKVVLHQATNPFRHSPEKRQNTINYRFRKLATLKLISYVAL